MPTLMVQVNVAWFLITAVVTWNMGSILPFVFTFLAVGALVGVQSSIIHTLARLVLGPLGVSDFDAMYQDTSPLSMSCWFAVFSTHVSGIDFVFRHLVLLGLQRMLRVPAARLALWQSLSPVSKARVVAYAVMTWAFALLACAYWATDQYDHPTHLLLLSEGMCVLLSATWETAFVLWTYVSYDLLDRGQPDANDTAVLLVSFVEAIAGLLLTLFVTSADRPLSAARANATGPPLQVQALLLKRIWIVASTYSRYSRALSILEGLPDVNPAQLTGGASQCTICLESMTGKSGGKRLPCGHVFHAHCLRRWLMSASSCPLCRRRSAHLGARRATMFDVPGADAGDLANAEEGDEAREPTIEEQRAAAAALTAAMERARQRRGMRARTGRSPAQPRTDTNDGGDDDDFPEAPQLWPFGPPRRQRQANAAAAVDGPGGNAAADATADAAEEQRPMINQALLDAIFGSPARPPTEMAFPVTTPRQPAPAPAPAAAAPAAAAEAAPEPFLGPTGIPRPRITAEEMLNIRRKVEARVRAWRDERRVRVACDAGTQVGDGDLPPPLPSGAPSPTFPSIGASPAAPRHDDADAWPVPKRNRAEQQQ